MQLARNTASCGAHHPGEHEPGQQLPAPGHQRQARIDHDLRQVVRAGHQLKRAPARHDVAALISSAVGARRRRGFAPRVARLRRAQAREQPVQVQLQRVAGQEHRRALAGLVSVKNGLGLGHS